MAFKFGGKEMYLIFVFAKCCWSIDSRVVRFGKKQAEKTTPSRENHSHTNSAVTRQVCIDALLVQHLYSVFFKYMVWYGPTSETAWMQRRQKNWLKYTAFTELKKKTNRIYSNCSNYSSLFFNPSNFLAVRSVSLKNIYS